MNWSILQTEEQLADLLEKSFSTPQLIYKHSSRCSLSSVIKSRLEKSPHPEHIRFHLLDLIALRSLSNKIAAGFNVHHESPQVLLIKDGKCIYDESHMSIQMDEITGNLA